MNASASRSRQRTSSAGFVLVAVLWIFAALATLASIYVLYVVDTASTLVVQNDRLQLDGLVRAAVELTAYQLTMPSAARPTHGEFVFRLGPAKIATSFRSEASRIDINLASKELLSGLFAVLGAKRDEANNYADRIIEWRTTRPAEQASPISVSTDIVQSRRAPFPAVGEVFMVGAIPPALLDQALRFVTVYSGRPQVNIVDAAPEVIAALPGMTESRLRALLAERETSRESTGLMRLLGPAAAYATLEGGNTFRITTRIAFDDGLQAAAEVVIVLFESGPEPFAVLSWQEVQG